MHRSEKLCVGSNADRDLAEHMEELGAEDTEDYEEKVLEFLEEIQRAGGGDCYVGTYPPQRCYHKNFQNLELYAFAWESPGAGKRRPRKLFSVNLLGLCAVG